MSLSTYLLVRADTLVLLDMYSAHTHTHTWASEEDVQRERAIPHSAPTQTPPLVSLEPPNRNWLDYFYRQTIFSFFLLLFGRQQQFGHTATVRAAAQSKYREQYAQHPHPHSAGPTGLRLHAAD